MFYTNPRKFSADGTKQRTYLFCPHTAELTNIPEFEIYFRGIDNALQMSKLQ